MKHTMLHDTEMWKDWNDYWENLEIMCVLYTTKLYTTRVCIVHLKSAYYFEKKNTQYKQKSLFLYAILLMD